MNYPEAIKSTFGTPHTARYSRVLCPFPSPQAERGIFFRDIRLYFAGEGCICLLTENVAHPTPYRMPLAKYELNDFSFRPIPYRMPSAKYELN